MGTSQGYNDTHTETWKAVYLKNTDGWNESWVRAILPLGFAIASGNAISLIVFLRKEFRTKKSTYLLINLTVADFMVGLASMSVFASRPKISSIKDDKIFAVFIGLLAWLNSSIGASLYSLAAVAVERAFAIFRPFKHRCIGKRFYITISFAVWTIWALTFTLFNLSYFKSANKTFLTLTVSCIIASILLLIFGSYLSIWIKMKFFSAIQHSTGSALESKKLCKTLFVVTVVSFGSWLPRTIANAVFHRFNATFSYDVTLVLWMLSLSNSLWNIFVYLVRMPQFRKELKRLFGWQTTARINTIHNKENNSKQNR